jgi:hypothetical protein
MNTMPGKIGKIAVGFLAINSVVVFTIALFLFVSKWFPYGPLASVREWLYKFF